MNQNKFLLVNEWQSNHGKETQVLIADEVRITEGKLFTLCASSSFCSILSGILEVRTLSGNLISRHMDIDKSVRLPTLIRSGSNYYMSTGNANLCNIENGVVAEVGPNFDNDLANYVNAPFDTGRVRYLYHGTS